MRWQTHQGAKLRTLLCTVVRQVLANQARIQTGRVRLLKEELARGGSPLQAYTAEPVEEPLDTFYGAWVEDLLRSCVDGRLQEYHTAGKGDYFRVLYGRLCEGLSVAEVSRALRIKLTDAENYFKAARHRLSQKLQIALREQVARYCDATSVAAEFDEEWKRLGEFLERHGAWNSPWNAVSGKSEASASAAVATRSWPLAIK